MNADTAAQMTADTLLLKSGTRYLGKPTLPGRCCRLAGRITSPQNADMPHLPLHLEPTLLDCLITPMLLHDASATRLIVA